MALIKTLQPNGNSQALVIDKPLMEVLGITAATPLQVTVHGNALIVTPLASGLGEAKVLEIVRKLRPRYGKMLQNLAK